MERVNLFETLYIPTRTHGGTLQQTAVLPSSNKERQFTWTMHKPAATKRHSVGRTSKPKHFTRFHMDGSYQNGNA